MKIVMTAAIVVFVWSMTDQVMSYDIVQFPVYTGSGAQILPAVDANVVVWIDEYRSVHYKNISTGQDHVIDTSRNYYSMGSGPSVSGDTIVWCDSRNTSPGYSNNLDIYSYNISTNTEYPICTDIGQTGPHNDINGNIAVWVDDRNANSSYDIYGYNRLSGEEFSVCTDSGTDYFPVTNGEVVAWHHSPGNGKWDIYGYDISSQAKFPICTGFAADNADISENIVVWDDNRNGLRDIYGYNLDTQTEFSIITASGSQVCPSISGNFVVWQDDRNGDWDIFGYDLITHTEFPIATGLGDQITPSISGYTVVWESNGDIYGAYIPEPATLSLLAIGILAIRKKKVSIKQI